MIPIERKRTRAPKRPYDGDLIQAIAYCVLVEDKYGEPPPYARIQYADRWFDVSYTPERKHWALDVSQRLREARRARAVNRSHGIAGKCRTVLSARIAGRLCRPRLNSRVTSRHRASSQRTFKNPIMRTLPRILGRTCNSM
jgi:hypothetical protein